MGIIHFSMYKSILVFIRGKKHCTKMKFSIKDFFSKCDRNRNFLWIWSHLLKKSLNRKLHFLCREISVFLKKNCVLLKSMIFKWLSPFAVSVYVTKLTKIISLEYDTEIAIHIQQIYSSWYHYDVFIVNFEHIQALIWCFNCQLLK